MIKVFILSMSPDWWGENRRRIMFRSYIWEGDVRFRVEVL